MSAIGGIGCSMMQGMGGSRGTMQRPDAAKMAENLFSQLDTSGKGYLQKADLQSAIDKTSATDATSASGASSVDDLLNALDTDSDGKVTQQEFTDTLKKLHDQLEQQFQDGRMQMAMQQAGGMGQMPPPPPPRGGNDKGFTKDELSSQLEQIGSSDSKRSSLISSIVQNFDQADADGDDKVSFKEAMAYRQSTSAAGSSQTANASASTTSSTAKASGSEDRWIAQVVKLMHAYAPHENSSSTSSLSVSA